MKRYDSYKPSGISWIGEIPSHWEVIDVSRLFNFQRGISFTKDLLCESGEPVITYGQVHSKKNKGYTLNKELVKYIPKSLTVGKNNAKCEFGDIVFADTSEDLDGCGNCIFIDDDNGIYAGYHTFFIKPKNHIVSQFFPFLFLSKQWRNQITENCTEVKVYSVTQSILRRCKVLIPPLDEQKKIVEYLSTKTLLIDAQQRERERELRLLEELKQAEIANVVTCGLNPDVPMKDSGIPWIGQIPAHWEVKRLGAFFNDNISSNSEYKFDRAYKFNYGTIVPKNEIGDVSDLRETYLKYSVLKQDDIIINGLNLNYDFVSQRVAISPTDCIITSAYIVLRPASNTYSQYFLQLFKAMDSKKLFHGMGTGIRLTLSFNELKSQMLPIPPLDEQRAIVEYIEQKNKAIDDMIANLRAEIDFLTEYKQRLIADAVTGQIKID